VSLGANNVTKLVGTFKENLPIEAFVSISNPFNLTKASYIMHSTWFGNFISKYIANNGK